MHRRLQITDLNPHLICVLCGGYYIDATTVIECLHSFCRSCIVRYLETSKYCPICDVQIHKTKPLLNIRSDQTLQEIVYKLVPGLFQNEMKRRRDFYAQHPHAVIRKSSTGNNEEYGEVDGEHRFMYNPDENVSFSLEYSERGRLGAPPDEIELQERRYLQCPAAVTISHLKKLIRAKYGLNNDYRVDVIYAEDCLKDDYTLMDVAYIYTWRRKGPLRLYYRIHEQPFKKQKITHQPVTVTKETPADNKRTAPKDSRTDDKPAAVTKTPGSETKSDRKEHPHPKHSHKVTESHCRSRGSKHLSEDGSTPRKQKRIVNGNIKKLLPDVMESVKKQLKDSEKGKSRNSNVMNGVIEKEKLNKEVKT